MRKTLLFLGLIICSITISLAQKLQSPSEFLGYELGSEFSRHHQVVDYFKHVSETMPDMVKLTKYGETYERRPLYTAFISTVENMANLETIRKNNLSQIGALDGESYEGEVAIVWLSYNVHGNEASSTEASMNTLFKLITEKQDWLKNTVVIIDPCVNPDGRDRYANWYNKTKSSPYNIDQQASEHNEPWPGGRPNHYLFDLNRDWAWATQIESQSRLKVYNKWLPHIHVDFHEQGINEPYYFAPAAEPFHEIISNWQRDFQTTIGKNNAKYFDEEGWLYFTKERFDLLYPSYGDTYPTFMGAIGMTYEQGGHGRAGLGIMTDEGSVLTLKNRIAHHTTTGLSTVETASLNAERLNSEFRKFFDTNEIKVKSYLLRGDEDKISSIASLLDTHEIQYGFADNNKVSGVRYSNNNIGSLNATNKDLIVSIDQAKGKMVKALFEPRAQLSDSLTYDITAWSLPYAYGLDAIASNKLIKTKVIGKTPEKNTINPKATGYILSWTSLQDAKFLAELLQENYKIRFSEKPFSSDGEQFNRGSLIIVRGDNTELKTFDNDLIAIANKHGRKLHAATTGFATSGPDFGSPDIKLVNKHKVAMLSGNYTSSLSYGALWHFFEQQLKYPVTSINTDDLLRTDLYKYDILIMPHGYYGRLINKDLRDKLKDWVKKGGKLIAFDGAMKAFAGKEGFDLSVKKKEEDSTAISNNKLIPYADRERANAKNLITGSIFKTTVDNTHPMAYGYPDHYYTLKLGSNAFNYLKSGYNVAYLEKEPQTVSGFAGSEAVKKLDETLVFGEERQGKGSFIYFVDDVMFRSFWENGKMFLVNSLFFVNNNAFEL